MKMLRYSVIFYQITTNIETMEREQIETPAVIETRWSEEAEARARAAAIGDVEIYENGDPDPAQPAVGGVTFDEMAAAILEGVNDV